MSRCSPSCTTLIISDVCTEIREEAVRVNKPPRLTQVILPDGYAHNPDCQHSFLSVDLGVDDRYAFDLSCAQFGIGKPVMPRAAYVQDFGVIEDERNPLGKLDIFDEDKAGAVAQHNHLLVDKLKKAIKSWEAANVDLASLIKLPWPIYEKYSKELISSLDRSMREGFEAMHAPDGQLQKFETYTFPAGVEVGFVDEHECSSGGTAKERPDSAKGVVQGSDEGKGGGGEF